MRTPSRTVGPRGVALLAAAGLAGVVLAIHGWTGQKAHSPLGPISSGVPSASASTRASDGVSARSSKVARGTPGPLLASQSFASYAFVVWPGTPTAAAKAALTGLSVSVHRRNGGLSVSAVVNGQQSGSSHFYPGGVRVYIVEASMGDDSGASDYNLGDDGLAVTDASGRIVS